MVNESALPSKTHPVLNVSNAYTHLIPSTALWDRDYDPHFTDLEPGAQTA